MKFEYEVSKEDRECVAFIDDEGDLCVNADGAGCAYFLTNGRHFINEAFGSFEDYVKDNDPVQKFYPGDKITITF